jgi:hypothetical protein
VTDAPATLNDVCRELKQLRVTLASPQSELLTANQAARFLGVGRTKFFEMVAAVAALKPVKLPGAGKRWRRTDLIAFVTGLTD